MTVVRCYWDRVNGFGSGDYDEYLKGYSGEHAGRCLGMIEHRCSAWGGSSTTARWAGYYHHNLGPFEAEKILIDGCNEAFGIEIKIVEPPRQQRLN